MAKKQGGARYFIAGFSGGSEWDYVTGTAVLTLTPDTAFTLVRASLAATALRALGLPVTSVQLWEEWVDWVVTPVYASAEEINEYGWTEVFGYDQEASYDANADNDGPAIDGSSVSASDDGVDFEGVEKYGHQTVSLPTFRLTKLLDVAGLPITVGEAWPAEASPLLFAWSVIRGVCQQGGELLGLEETSYGYLLRANVQCARGQREALFQELGRLQAVIPQAVIHHGYKVVMVSYAEGNRTHILEVAFP